MKENYTPYKRKFKESNVDEIIGFLKARYNSIKKAQADSKFKKLPEPDKEYVVDELKADGMK